MKYSTKKFMRGEYIYMSGTLYRVIRTNVSNEYLLLDEKGHRIRYEQKFVERVAYRH